MPVFSQQERIEISKKIVSIPEQNQGAMDTKQSLIKERQKVEQEDSGNKQIFNDYNRLANLYQFEIERYDGKGRTPVSEQNLIDSSTNKTGNFFYPNQPTVPTPAIPNGVWINLIPYAGNIAVGKNYQETFPTITKEQDKIDAIQTILTTINTYTEIIRTTGQSCVAGMPDTIANEPIIQGLILNLITAVNDWKSFIQATKALIVLDDPNATRQNQNNLSIANADYTISQIDIWLALPNFATNHMQTTCSGFNGYNPYLLVKTKLRNDGLLVLTNAISQRTAFITSRIAQITTNLGTVVQNVSNGQINSSSGLYGDRFSTIAVRIDGIGGTLRKALNSKLREGVLDSIVDSNNNALSVYAPFFVVSGFKAPSTGNKNIFVKNPAGFAIGNSVYIVANDQPEIQVTIENIDGNRLVVSEEISVKYTTGNGSRVYKINP